MNRDDIIRMAREAGVSESELFPGEQAIERFAALVAAAEREVCAKLCVKVAYSDYPKTNEEILVGLVCADAIEAREFGIPVEKIIEDAIAEEARAQQELYEIRQAKQEYGG